MMGTLASVMAGKKIRTFKDRFMATVTGDIEEVNGILKITRIDVKYLLKLPDQQRDSAIACFDLSISSLQARSASSLKSRLWLQVGWLAST